MPARDQGLALLAIATGCCLAVAAGESPSFTPQNPPESGQPIRVGVELITTDVVVRDRNGRFVPDLGKGEFVVHEDGVRQEVVSFLLSHGGRIYNIATPPVAQATEGVLLPPVRPVADAAGRVFVIFIDDFHLDAQNTPRIRNLLKEVSSQLIHEGDLFAVVSTGYSSIAVEPTYDRKRLDQAIQRVMGGGLQPNEILEAPVGAQGHAERRHRAHVAFRTASDIMQNLQQVPNRRKAFIYISSGYDFAPFQKTRDRLEAERYGRAGEPGTDDVNPFLSGRTQFSEADLAMELAELTRAANRANATIYTIDPRGLVGGPDLNQQIDMVEWQNYVTGAQNSLRVLAESTGGFATVNRNDFTAALKRIDSETSDYYMIGYYSSNRDPSKRRRSIEVKVKRPALEVTHRKEYVLPPPER
jgi:VWFA-related protein